MAKRINKTRLIVQNIINTNMIRKNALRIRTTKPPWIQANTCIVGTQIPGILVTAIVRICEAPIREATGLQVFRIMGVVLLHTRRRHSAAILKQEKQYMQLMSRENAIQNIEIFVK